MAIATPRDNGNGAVVNVQHPDGATMRTVGPFETVEAAADYAEEMNHPNGRLQVTNLMQP